MEDLADGLRDVAVVLEVLGQRGEIARHLPEVVLQVEDARGIWAAPGQERGSAGGANRLLHTGIHSGFSVGV